MVLIKKREKVREKEKGERHFLTYFPTNINILYNSKTDRGGHHSKVIIVSALSQIELKSENVRELDNLEFLENVL